MASAQQVFFNEGWTQKPAEVNKSVNMGVQVVRGLAWLKNCTCDVIRLLIYLRCDVINASSHANLVCYIFLHLVPFD